jgi:hypothetical protein
VRATSVGLLIEEQRGEVAAAWKRAVEMELGGEPALEFAVGPLLREMALALRAEPRGPRAAGAPTGAGADLRSTVLVRSGALPARVAREFKLIHRALWETIRAAGGIVGADERRAADEWLDEALVAALDRIDRVRARAELLGPAPGASRRPPPLPRMRGGEVRPPPLPSAPLGIE